MYVDTSRDINMQFELEKLEQQEWYLILYFQLKTY